jgi:hypothetical protein
MSLPPPLKVLSSHLGALTLLTSLYLDLGPSALNRDSGLLESLKQLPALRQLALQRADVTAQGAVSLAHSLEYLPCLQVRVPTREFTTQCVWACNVFDASRWTCLVLGASARLFWTRL